MLEKKKLKYPLKVIVKFWSHGLENEGFKRTNKEQDDSMN